MSGLKVPRVPVFGNVTVVFRCKGCDAIRSQPGDVQMSVAQHIPAGWVPRTGKFGIQHVYCEVCI